MACYTANQFSVSRSYIHTQRACVFQGLGKVCDVEADAIVIVYSIIDRGSLKEAQDIMDSIMHRASFSIPVLLLGNKTDLEHLRQVSRDDVVLLTHQYRCRHCEISVAESYSSVDAPMQELLSQGLENRRVRLSQMKRRKSIFENVSRRLGNVFRRKSLEEQTPKRKDARKKENINRRSL